MSKKVIKKNHKVLDFGCGRGTDYTWLKSNGMDAEGYDPYWKPDKPLLNKKYDVITCSYVLNVVGPKERQNIIKLLKGLTKEGGTVYLTVRRDMKSDYVTKKGTQQYLVYLPYEILKETSEYCIYKIKMIINKVYKKDLSDLDINNLPDGFSIVFDERDKPIAALVRYEYYQYLSKLIAKVKDYVSKAKPKIPKQHT